MTKNIISIVWLILLSVCFRLMQCDMHDFSICHDDFSLKPADGILKEHTFPWIAFTQYVHVITGLQHTSRAPRVILIHKQFVLGTATDMLQLPRNYKLGNVIFGDYERDEVDCGLTQQEIIKGQKCPKAYMEVPILATTPHPEYIRFGVVNSLVLVKLLRFMKSSYVIPICLPRLEERYKLKRNKLVFLVDYTSLIPRDFDFERMAKKTLKLYTHMECQEHVDNSIIENVSHALCSSGCGVRTGAPIINQALDGRFELIGLAISSGPCSTEDMRERLNTQPPLYIDVFPYSTWIVNVITAHSIPKTYPLHFHLAHGVSDPVESVTRSQRSGWKGRTFFSGNLCFANSKAQQRASFFYAEKFEVNNIALPTRLNVEIKISAGIECTIACVRLLLPNRLKIPVIDGVGSFNITVKFSTTYLPHPFAFLMALSGSNSTKKNIDRWLPLRIKENW